MAGLSSRFTRLGFNLPKYMLRMHDNTVFEYAVSSFSKYFRKEHFIFIVLNEHGSHEFITQKLDGLNVLSRDIVALDHRTRGQAETVYAGLTNIAAPKNEPIVIFNIDSVILNYAHHQNLSTADGTLDVVERDGDHWSFIAPDMVANCNKVLFTTEKRRIANLCSTGLYTFKNFELYSDAFRASVAEMQPMTEIYIAPMYNYLIGAGCSIHYRHIDDHYFVSLGTPAEYYSSANKLTNMKIR